MDDITTPPSANTSARIAIATSIVIVLLIIAIILFRVFAPENNEEASVLPTPSRTISPISSVPTIPPTPVEPSTPTFEEGVLTYSSPRLEISFEYMLNDPLAPNNVENIQIQETGNRIYVYPKSLPPDQGQFVEIFPKSPDESIEDAIKRLFLTGKDPTRCIVTVTQPGDYPKTITHAEITFPPDLSESPESREANTQYCSPDYAQTNGVRFFQTDINNPSVLLFFNIGQYGIMAGDNTPWQQTVRIAN